MATGLGGRETGAKTPGKLRSPGSAGGRVVRASRVGPLGGRSGTCSARRVRLSGSVYGAVPCVGLNKTHAASPEVRTDTPSQARDVRAAMATGPLHPSALRPERRRSVALDLYPARRRRGDQRALLAVDPQPQVIPRMTAQMASWPSTPMVPCQLASPCSVSPRPAGTRTPRRPR